MRLLSLVLSIILLAACSTPRGTEARRQKALDAVGMHDYATAAAMVDKIYGGKGDEGPGKEKHRLLWYMQKSALAVMQNDFKRTEQFTTIAGELVDARRGISVGGAVGSAMANETVRAYDGEAFEHIQVDLVRSLNHLVQAQILEGIYVPSYEIIKDTDGSMNGPGVVDATIDFKDHYERARNAARRMTLDQLKETEDAAGRRRYKKDPFANLYTGALVMAMPKPNNPDRQLADAMFFRAMEAYPEDIDVYAKDRNFEFELRGVPKFAETLQARNGLIYNNKDYKSKEKLNWKKGQGSLLIIQQDGFIARPKTLDIRIISAVGAAPKDSQQFHVGGVAFYANGPQTSGLETLSALQLPGDVVDDFFGSGLAVMGFAMPVHEADETLPGLGLISVFDQSGNTTVEQELAVVSDLDAYARATLKDEQGPLFIKTFTRAAAKQVAAHVAAEEAMQEDVATGLFTRFFGSAVATMTEVADTRSWWLLPNHISATMIDLPAGTYRLHISHGGGSMDLGEVTIQENRLAIIPSRTFKP